MKQLISVAFVFYLFNGALFASVKNMLFIQAKHDHNSAFNSEGDLDLKTQLESLDNYRLTYKVGVDSKRKLPTILADAINNAFDEGDDEFKISHIIFSGHGSQKTFAFSENLEDNFAVNDDSTFEIFNILEPYLDDYASVYFHSCCTAAGFRQGDAASSLASWVSSILPGKTVMGSNGPFKRDQVGMIITRAGVEYRSFDPSFNIWKFFTIFDSESKEKITSGFETNLGDT